MGGQRLARADGNLVLGILSMVQSRAAADDVHVCECGQHEPHFARSAL